MSKSAKNVILLIVIGILIAVTSNLISGGFKTKSTNELLVQFMVNQVYSLFLGFLNIFYFAYLERLKWGKNDRVKRIAIGIVGSIGVTMLGLFILRLLTAVVLDGKSMSSFIENETLRNYQFGLWVTLTLVVIFHLIYFYNRYQQNRIKEQKFIAGTASAKFDALKNQLDPHFLFNSLNVLSSLIEENPENAQEFTTALSKVYRYVLEQKNKELVLVDEELQFAKTYMSLLKMRFEDSIIFTMPEKSENPESKVVPLSLQLLLENAVKHNMVTTSKPLHIKIYEEQGALVVDNNLQPKQIVKKSSGVGLANIKERYHLLTNKKINIVKEANRFVVAIPILTKQVSVMRPKDTKAIDDSYLRARNHVEELKGFYYSLISYVFVIPFLIFINYKTSWQFQWFWFPLFGWGLGLSIQAFKVFVGKGAFGRSWEKRKIEEFMQEDEKDSRWH